MRTFQICPYIEQELTADQRRRINILQNWDLSAVSSRTAQRLGWSQAYAAEVEVEYKKFLALIILGPSTVYGMTGPTDELWHEHVWHTENYIELCSEIAGRVIHHLPSSDGDIACDRAYSENTLPGLDRSFVGIRSAIWPASTGGACRACIGCKSPLEKGNRMIRF